MRVVIDGAGRVGLDPASLGLTEAQQAALAFDRERVVTAGAGAGKTHTLALRFVSLLLALADQGVDDVGRVLVLTFTDKAAHEMAERCRQALGALIVAARAADLADRGPGLVARLERMEERFDRARIGTFHAFCASVLREFPAATRTPPGAAPLPPGEARRWTDVALEEALEEHLARAPGDLAPLLDAFGRRAALLEAGRVALGRLGLLEDVLRRHAAGRVRVADLLAAAPVRPEQAREWVERVALPNLELLRRLVAPSGGGPFVRRALEPAWASLRAPPPAGDVLRTYAWYREVLDLLLTDAGTVRQLDHHSVIGTRDRWPDDRRYKLAKDGAKALQQRLGDWEARARAAASLPTPADEALLAALEPFARWVLAAADRLGAELDRRHRLTFEEMQRRAVRAVLGDEALRSALRDRFRYLMVDEFQDTDAQQWSLVFALGRADPAAPEDRLFLVGDPKQAIYGFRGGDVTVFGQAVRALGAEPVVLADNFRSRPGLITWFNALFPTVLGADAAAPYAPMVPRREDGGGDVVVVRVADEEQAQAAASWIAGALQRDPALLASPTPPIAVLLRSRTRQPRYEAALRAAGVPYVVVGGIGFWSRPEVLDAVNVVCAVATRDPVSIAGALRSPLVGRTDPELQALAGRIADGERWLAAWSRRRHEIAPSALIREIAAALGPTLALEEGAAPGRATANLERLAAWVAPHDELGLAAVADRLLAEIALEAREAEAALVPSEARVVVCTVHAAKGLEFPVVVVPELGARPRTDAPALLVGRLAGDAGFHLASRVYDPDADVETRVEPGRYAALAEVLRRDQDAEARRLLYVACTRARDALVLVGTEQPEAEPGARATWMQWIDRGLPPRTPTLSSVPPATVAAPRAHAPPAPRPDPDPLPLVRALELSASALDRLAACPARWYRRDHLGLAEAPTSMRDRNLEIAAARGQVVHQVLQDGVHGDPSAVRRRWRVAAIGLGADDAEIDSGYERLVAHLTATAAAPEVRRALQAPGWAEVPLRAEHAGIALTGRIDRLWLDREAGGFVVSDWKSDALRGRAPEEVAADHAAQLHAYAWAADRVLVARGRPGVVRTEVVLTEVGATVPVGGPVAADDRSVLALLERAAATAAAGWTAVERAATAGDTPRPCASCGFAGRGCRGVPAG